MTREESKASLEKEFKEGIGIFKTIVTGFELILGGQYLIESLGQPADSHDPYRKQSTLKGAARAFALARRRHVLLTSNSGRELKTDVSHIDEVVMREFDRVRANNFSTGNKNLLSVGPVAELVERADQTQKQFDDLVQEMSDPPDEMLPPDGSGGAQPNTDGGGGSGGAGPNAPVPIDPGGGGLEFSSFDQYPEDVQAQAIQHYDLEVEPQAREFVRSTLSTIAGGGDVSLGNLNSTLAGMVAGVAAGIGGPIGAGLAALALILIPRMLAEVEEALGFGDNK